MPLRIARRQALAVRSRRCSARQPHREGRACARLARNRHVAPHQARELAGDGEAEPSAAKALRGRGIGLRKLPEQLELNAACRANALTTSSH